MSEAPTDHGQGTDPASGTHASAPVAPSLTPLGQTYLDQARPWVRFMAVLTYIAAALMVLVGLVMFLVSAFGGPAVANRAGLGAFGGPIAGGAIALLYVGLACLYIAPGLFLSRYARAIERLKASPSSSGLEEALKHQKSFWRFVGIMSAIGIALAVMVLGLAIVVGAITALSAAQG